MKIGIFTELFYPSIGGMESRYKELAKALAENGHQVSIYCIGHINSLGAYENINGIDVHRYPIVKNYKQPFLKPLKRAIIPLFRYAFWSSKILSTEHFDFIIYNQWPFFHAIFSPQNTRNKSAIDWCEIRLGKVYQLFQKKLPQITRFNMAVSPSVCNSIQIASGKSVYFLPSGINLQLYSSLEYAQRNSILCIGRIADHKNLPLLIEAFELLKDSGYCGRLILAGDGPAFDSVTAQVHNSRHNAHIDLLGLVSEEKKIKLLSESELLVLPSKREGFPQVVAEAMASGLPVVTCEFPENGTASVVEYYGCGLVSKPDPSSLSQTISKTLADWQRYSEICLNASKELDWSILVKSLEQELMSKVND
jgi:glycosyltransferase involved in cell wall biosynthesis